MIPSTLIPPSPRCIAVVVVRNKEDEDNPVTQYAQRVVVQLRSAGIPVSYAFEGNTTKQLKKLSQKDAVAAVIIGEDEMKKNSFTVKLLDSGTQQSIESAGLEQFCKRLVFGN
jgi:histidyl-tRNA synthetase